MSRIHTFTRENLAMNASRETSRQSVVRALGGSLVAGGTLVVPGFAVAKKKPKKITRRPIGDFTETQGSTNEFFPPAPDLPDWAPQGDAAPFYSATVDYPAAIARFFADNGRRFGTKAHGTVLERALDDGRAHVTVELVATKALTWAFEDGEVPAFGFNPSELLEDATLRPALGVCRYTEVFINSAPGAPLPDIGLAFVYGDGLEGVEEVALEFHFVGIGRLREAFGHDAGSLGKLTIAQTARFDTCDSDDCFAVEDVIIEKLGPGGHEVQADAVSRDRVRSSNHRKPRHKTGHRRR